MSFGGATQGVQANDGPSHSGQCLVDTISGRRVKKIKVLAPLSLSDIPVVPYRSRCCPPGVGLEGKTPHTLSASGNTPSCSTIRMRERRGTSRHRSVRSHYLFSWPRFPFMVRLETVQRYILCTSTGKIKGIAQRAEESLLGGSSHHSFHLTGALP